MGKGVDMVKRIAMTSDFTDLLFYIVLIFKLHTNLRIEDKLRQINLTVSWTGNIITKREKKESLKCHLNRMFLLYHWMCYFLKRKKDSKKSLILLSNENMNTVKADMPKMATTIKHGLDYEYSL